MDELNSLQSMGLTLPGPAYIAGAILFSIIGYAAYRYGKKQSRAGPKWIGIALMLYSYVTPETWMMYSAGAALCVALYFFRN
jgi:hypothetical protein